ncbi:MAG: hypothetical protein WC271_09955 [Bacteroidales bacterium]|jgi:hypothetical protein|nr:hypothetical protein [Bacteroidales bacterium]MDY0202235.1 hypothetical protein [Tenuifilaceae bacterium]
MQETENMDFESDYENLYSHKSNLVAAREGGGGVGLPNPVMFGLGRRYSIMVRLNNNTN